MSTIPHNLTSCRLHSDVLRGVAVYVTFILMYTSSWKAHPLKYYAVVFLSICVRILQSIPSVHCCTESTYMHMCSASVLRGVVLLLGGRCHVAM